MHPNPILHVLEDEYPNGSKWLYIGESYVSTFLERWKPHTHTEILDLQCEDQVTQWVTPQGRQWSWLLCPGRPGLSVSMAVLQILEDDFLVIADLSPDVWHCLPPNGWCCGFCLWLFVWMLWFGSLSLSLNIHCFIGPFLWLANLRLCRPTGKSRSSSMQVHLCSWVIVTCLLLNFGISSHIWVGIIIQTKPCWDSSMALITFLAGDFPGKDWQNCRLPRIGWTTFELLEICVLFNSLSVSIPEVPCQFLRSSNLTQLLKMARVQPMKFQFSIAF